MMSIKKLAVVVILLSSFLLNSTVSAAIDLSEPGIQKVASKKEEAIQKKFADIKKWMQDQKPVLDKWFSDNMAKFKQEMGRIFKQITEKIQKFQNEKYTQLKMVNHLVI